MASMSYVRVSRLVELLSETSKHSDMYVSIIGDNRLALGSGLMQADYILDFSEESLKTVAVSNANGATEPDVSFESQPRVRQLVKPPRRGARRSGVYWVDLLGHRTECVSLKDVLSKSLLAIEDARPGMLKILSGIRPRSKRIVALDPQLLFQSSLLVEKYAQPLDDKWWFGTNNSAPETSEWLKRACECSKLKWGKDLILSF